jgi:hypothetical protein
MRLVSSTAISACIFLPALALGVPAAHADEVGPVAGCPTGFFLTVPETMGGEADRNGDGYICVKPGPRGVRVDNTVPAR